ncbi:MAG TPA: tRNA pseudouridine synthase A [Edaphocola sp.]|nr:tRNA pseudouridine synthase A [Edaphocola sp.]
MRYFLEVSYNGLAFHGSQIQGELSTVQLSVNRAVSTILRQPVETFGASRTDEGVHALSNFYHFDAEDGLPGNFVYRMNAILPFEVAVLGCYLPKGQENANARFDALSRHYRYRLYTSKDPFLHHRAYFYPYKIDRVLLKETANLLLGRKDFTSFSKRNTQTRTFFCTVEEACWTFGENTFCFDVRANRFLRGMVRALVGTQLQVARGKMTLSEFEGLFGRRDCRLADFSVPGYGLYLEKIIYPEGYFL